MQWEYTKAGQFHIQSERSCQDRILYRDGDRFAAAAVSDGATGCSFSEIGAEAVCCAAVNYFNDGEVFSDHYSEEKVAYLLNEYILYVLEKTAENNGQSASDYACTLAAVCIDKRQKRAVAVNLGDGAVLRVKNRAVGAWLGPHRINDQPCLFPDRESGRHIRVKYFDLSDQDTLLLCTDGFLYEYGIPDHEELREAVKSLDFLHVNDLLDKIDHEDDLSYVAISDF